MAAENTTGIRFFLVFFGTAPASKSIHPFMTDGRIPQLPAFEHDGGWRKTMYGTGIESMGTVPRQMAREMGARGLDE